MAPYAGCSVVSCGQSIRRIDPPKVRREDLVGVEVDALPGGFVCAASKGIAKRGRVKQAVAGAHSIGKLFSKKQRTFTALDFFSQGA
mgnify:CR=1 FL=1